MMRTRTRNNISRWLIPALIGVIVTAVATFGILSFTQDNTDASIRQSLFEQQLDRQLDTNLALARHIGSDLDSIMMRLQVLANLEELQSGDLSSPKVRQLAGQYLDMADKISYVDHLFIFNNANIAVLNIAKSPEQQTFEGTDFSDRTYVKQARATGAPVFSDGFRGVDGKYRIALVHPIINRDTGEYIGLVGTALPTVEFFGQYGNIYEIKSQYMAVLDLKANHLVHGNQDLIGRSFFEEYTQQFTQGNKDLNNAMRHVLSGQPAHAVYTIQAGERLTSGHPIFVQDELRYVVFIVTPTTLIYSNIDTLLSESHTQAFMQQVALATAAGLFVVFAVWLNSNLNKEVKRRTLELETSNRQLAAANEQLKTSDRLQKEFIDIAAHELRTPVQPMIAIMELLGFYPLKKEEGQGEEEVRVSRADMKMIARNAIRLERLSSDILDATRIEGGRLVLHKQPTRLKELISVAVENATSQVKNANVKLVTDISDDIIAEVDPERIMQVLSNLLNNAIRYTEQGTITVTLHKHDGSAKVTVKDTGSGIHSSVMSRLFTKFASTTNTAGGTGLGLYIVKAIIDAHGGRIWAENNNDGRGASFSFTLPIQVAK
jgi:signal transduction histidine kinase